MDCKAHTYIIKCTKREFVCLVKTQIPRTNLSDTLPVSTNSLAFYPAGSQRLLHSNKRGPNVIDVGSSLTQCHRRWIIVDSTSFQLRVPNGRESTIQYKHYAKYKNICLTCNTFIPIYTNRYNIFDTIFGTE